MDVVPAGVHEWCASTAACGTRIGEAGLFQDGQPVHVSAQQHQRTRSVAYDPDDAGPANPRGDLETQGRKSCRDDFSGAQLLKAEFRVCVKILIQVCPVVRLTL